MTQEQELARALAPLADRVSRSSCWIKRNGKLSHLKQSLSDVKLVRHIAGPHAYGAAPIAPGESVTRVALLDFDSHKGEVSWPDMQERAVAVMRAAESDDLIAIPFRSSGGAGIHLYFIWDAPQDAYSVREALRMVLARVGLSVGVKGVIESEVELFPKQNEVPADGVGNMFVLPCAGQSVPLDTFELEPLERSALLNIDWPLSTPVAQLQRPEPQLPAAVGEVSVELSTLRAALNAIPNSGVDELDYDTWRNVIFALHDATGGSDEGLALAHEFSARSTKYNGPFLDERVWPYVRSERDGQTITGRTILHMAREHGWTEDVTDQFEVVEAPAADGAEPLDDLPDFLGRNPKTGAVPANATNMRLALRCRAIVPWVLGFDSFRDEIMKSHIDGAEWLPFDDTDYQRLTIRLEAFSFSKVAHNDLRRAVALAAHENTFDSAREWLDGLPAWDGVPRCATFLQRYVGADDTDYTRAASLYFWSGLAGRVLSPGVKAKMALILAGIQNAGKSTLAEIIAPDIRFFTTLDLAAADKEASRLMRGRLVIELPELKGLRSGSLDHIKAMISRTHEDIRNLYAEKHHQYARRFLFIGTTNDEEFLVDRTGNTRFLPVQAREVDLEALARDRDQLWAEGAALFKKHGVMWEDAARLATSEHAQYMVTDTWEETIAAWLADTDIDSEAPRAYAAFTTLQVLTGALNMNAHQADRRAQMRAADAIKALGYRKIDSWLGGRKLKYWIDPLI